VVGNVKFEQPMPAPRPEVRAVVRSLLGLEPSVPLWVAGSTHPGEDEQVLEAFRRARAGLPGLALLIAPRHVERAADVLALAQREGWRAARRSVGGDGPFDVLVLDTMGELADLYALADVVFLGGSLVPIGGHDLLQPLFHGKPELFGPHMHNQHDLAAMALREGAARQVADAGELTEWVTRLCQEADLRRQMGEAGARLLQANTGAAGRCARLLARLAGAEACPRQTLPEPEGIGA
jgi:3-deoxy-D-manno-octulosonic-acid transferase